MDKINRLLGELRAELANGTYFGRGLDPAITSVAHAQASMGSALKAMHGDYSMEGVTKNTCKVFHPIVRDNGQPTIHCQDCGQLESAHVEAL